MIRCCVPAVRHRWRSSRCSPMPMSFSKLPDTSNNASPRTSSHAPRQAAETRPQPTIVHVLPHHPWPLTLPRLRPTVPTSGTSRLIPGEYATRSASKNRRCQPQPPTRTPRHSQVRPVLDSIAIPGADNCLAPMKPPTRISSALARIPLPWVPLAPIHWRRRRRDRRS